jgi:UPF0755 protein
VIAVLLLVAAAGVAAFVAFGYSWEEAAPPPPPPPPPPPKPFRIIFPEGFTRTEMGVRVRVVAKIAEQKRKRKVLLNQRAYLLATRKAAVPCFGKAVRTNLEGFLFPATYDFLRQTTSAQLARAQLQAFCRNWKKVDLAYARSKNLTPYDVLTIASMIEREAKAPRERPLVAAVIYNRLHEGMPLGIDATLRYGLHIPATEAIRQSQLADDTPFNTRRHTGLPPTPIANPGLASIRAAAHPAKVNYLYYARKPDKLHHFFTASGDEFNAYLATHGYGG